MPIHEKHDLPGWLSGLTVTQGRLAGDGLTVLPWQRRFIRRAFRPDVTTAALSCGRGNGKSTLIAGLASAALVGPLRQPRAEVVIVASSLDQGRIVFEHVTAFLRAKLEVELLPRKVWRQWDTVHQAVVEHRPTGARVRCIGSDPKRAHGRAPLLVILDEPAQWPASTSEKMYAAMDTSLGKIPDSRLIAIGTRPADDEHWFAKLLDGGADYAQTHAAGKDDPPFRIRTWRKANPSLDLLPDLLAKIRKGASKAKRDAAALASFQALRLNLGVEETDTTNLVLEAGTWAGVEGDTARRGRPVWGVDLGGGAAFSAVAAYWPTSGKLEAVAAIPGIPNLKERGLKDGVGRLYADMAKRGELIAHPGRAVSVPALLREALRRYGRPGLVVADRWRVDSLTAALDKAKIPQSALNLRGQGFKDGGADMREFRAAVLEGHVTAERSLLLRSALAGARTVADPALNEKLARGTQGGRRRRHRDDAAAAAILAVASGRRLVGNAPKRPRLRWAI